ncbi:exodeoxyribonuclease V subunit alpha [Pseudomonas cremoricolorata]|uniref:RecBCD enzyme subunit RecD n=1 Tax=Pseudomonas cremoricolorata TaxID=157783 RepID=A0A089YC33_9PSED|nr:exodeoxyribonuclease V subunit alpha [Pseudomonas cremoricolorata]AIR89368.1 exodeoxyribonuclease V subunit alpha [Pseudomonas cremoricolorata]
MTDLFASVDLPAPSLNTTDELFVVLQRWVERGWLRPLDVALVRFLAEHAASAQPLVLLAAALTSHQLGHGHVCLDLAQTLAEPDFALSLPPEGEDSHTVEILPSSVMAEVQLGPWLDALNASSLVAQGEHGPHDRPLVLSGERLYLRRYWTYERAVQSSLHKRLALPVEVPDDLPTRLAALFPPTAEPRIDWQKLACALATRAALSIITGGPGTGKTTTVVRLLALLQGPRVAAERPLRIRLAAPTGKAAARLTESIGAQVQSLDVDPAIKARIPTEVTTVHRLLGSRPGTRHFRHHRGNPLPLDVLVVDEASMIDLEMMANLLEALPPKARLVLLGDKDQLASVEAGAVLGDLCRDAEAGFYSPATWAWLETVNGERLDASGLREGDEQRHVLAQQVVMLRHSRRFAEGSGIGELARAVNEQRPADARRALAHTQFADITSCRLLGEQDTALDRLLVNGSAQGRSQAAGYRSYFDTLQRQRPPATTALADPAWQHWAAAVLSAFDRFRILCAVRKGPWGVEAINQRATRALQAAGLIEGDHPWYEGRPVLITRNDYGLGLMNGDIGITLRLPEAEHSERLTLRVAFPRNDGQGGVRLVLPSRLNDVETVYAMTVHKSQGSEFEHTALILPDVLNPVLTKELVYTGITRARTWFTLVEPRVGVFEEAVKRRVRRLSGLMLEGGQGL